MKSRYVVLAAPVILVSLMAAPFADAQPRQSRPLTGFDAIEVGGGIDLFVRKGDGFVVEVEASEENAAKIVTEVVGRTLKIGRKSSLGFFQWGDLGSVHVTLPALVSLDASGGSDVKTEGTFASDNLRIGASGGSDLTIDVTAGTLHVEASGGSDLRVSGTARSAHIESSGGSDLNASALTADEADVDSSGGSDLAIGVRQKITGEASGGSDVTYTGAPGSVSVDTSGGAELHHR
jgi:putative autotransporter adhesin-like protein